MRIAVLTLLAVMLASVSYAQKSIIYDTNEDTGFQVYTGFGFKKNITKQFSITWSEELRLKDNASNIDRIHSSLGFSYQVCPYFKTGIDYTFISVKRDNNWDLRHRIHLDFTGIYPINERWKLSLRERIRMTGHILTNDPELEISTSWIMRSRLMAEYTIFAAPLKPYIYIEVSQTLNTPRMINNYMDKLRSSVGVKYQPSKRSEFELFYRMDYDISKKISRTEEYDTWKLSSNRSFNHIIGLFYVYSF